MPARFCLWLRRAFPRYFSVKDAARSDVKDARAIRAASEQQLAAERLTQSLEGLRVSLIHRNHGPD